MDSKTNKRKISYRIPYKTSQHKNGHSFGINCLAQDNYGNLFSGGRDSIIRQWEVNYKETESETVS